MVSVKFIILKENPKYAVKDTTNQWVEYIAQKTVFIMKIIILAAGKGSRWNNYLGIPKHLVNVGNERLIDRTIRLLKERGHIPIITVPENDLLGDLGIEKIKGRDTTELDKFLNCEPFIEESTLLLWGDTYFTESAIDIILKDTNDYRFFGRKKGSQITGKPYCEVFAVKVNKWLIEKCQELDKIRGNLTRCGSWEVYKFINNHPLDWISADYSSIPNHDFTEINDMTDDIDSKEDYEELLKRI